MIAEVGTIGFVLFAAHHVGDYWVQTDAQAQAKEHHAGACLAHVGTYLLTHAVFLAGLALATGWTPSVAGTLAGFAVTAVTHYLADRRAPLRWLAAHTGGGGFWDRGGAPLLDQAWHIGWLAVTALLIAS